MDYAGPSAVARSKFAEEVERDSSQTSPPQAPAAQSNWSAPPKPQKTAHPRSSEMSEDGIDRASDEAAPRRSVGQTSAGDLKQRFLETIIPYKETENLQFGFSSGGSTNSVSSTNFEAGWRWSWDYQDFKRHRQLEWLERCEQRGQHFNLPFVPNRPKVSTLPVLSDSLIDASKKDPSGESHGSGDMTLTQAITKTTT